MDTMDMMNIPTDTAEDNTPIIGDEHWLRLVKCDLDNTMSSKLETIKTATISSFINYVKNIFVQDQNND